MTTIHWKFYGLTNPSTKSAMHVCGVNIWEFEWLPTTDTATVVDPQHGTRFTFPVYSIFAPKLIQFAAGEFYLDQCGIYLKESDYPQNHTPNIKVKYDKPKQNV